MCAQEKTQSCEFRRANLHAQQHWQSPLFAMQLFLAWILILFLQSHCPYIRTVVRSSFKQKDPVNNRRKVFMEQKSLSNCDRKMGLIGVNLDLRVTRLPRGFSL